MIELIEVWIIALFCVGLLLLLAEYAAPSGEGYTVNCYYITHGHEVKLTSGNKIYSFKLSAILHHYFYLYNHPAYIIEYNRGENYHE